MTISYVSVAVLLLNVLTDLVVDDGMVQQVDHSFLLRLLLPLAPPDCLLDVEI